MKQDSDRIKKAIQWKMGLLDSTEGTDSASKDWEGILLHLKGNNSLKQILLDKIVSILIATLKPLEPTTSSVASGIQPLPTQEIAPATLKINPLIPESDGEIPVNAPPPKNPEIINREKSPDVLNTAYSRDPDSLRAAKSHPITTCEEPLPKTEDTWGRVRAETVTDAPLIPETSTEANEAASHLIPVEEAKPSAAPIPANAQWQYRPVPDAASEPDYHDEYDGREIAGWSGMRLVGARVRGKKHKHEGTHCDDWFEIACKGVWNLVAVSDGAGSKRFSRVGAKASCQAAIASLTAALTTHTLKQRLWKGETFQQDPHLNFEEEDLQTVAQALLSAMQAGQQAVQHAYEMRRDNLRHYKALGGRDLSMDDMLATLLLAVQTRVTGTDGKRSDLIMSCSVGDGMIAAISKEGAAHLLMQADSGQYSGETEFLSAKLAHPEALTTRIKVVFGSPQRALLVMTDGVSDDYFPNDRAMPRLYGDLVLNGIIEIPAVSEEHMAQALSQTLLPQPETIAAANFSVIGQQLTTEGTVSVSLGSITAYAQQLGLPIEEVLTSPALLEAGYRYRYSNEPPKPAPAQRLQRWLDAYHIRGSFDDRTLVAVFPEQLA